jgi:hypothetical protein
MEGRDQGPQEEGHPREGVAMHSSILPSINSRRIYRLQPEAPRAVRLPKVPTSEGGLVFDQMPGYATTWIERKAHPPVEIVHGSP